MRVSRLLGFIILAIVFGASFTLGPVTAGEHPWAEDPAWEPPDSTGSSANTSLATSSSTDGTDYDYLGLGTDLFWMTVVYQTVIEGETFDVSSGAEETAGE